MDFVKPPATPSVCGPNGCGAKAVAALVAPLRAVSEVRPAGVWQHYPAPIAAPLAPVYAPPVLSAPVARQPRFPRLARLLGR